MKKNPTTRFSKTVDHYIRYRPGYPAAIIPFMEEYLGFTNTSVIADIGSGTGKSTILFLENGNPVYAIEPNDAMREAGEDLMSNYAGFQSIAGRAEATNLPDNSVDFILAAQAFHWFDIPLARKEFRRILKPGGKVLLLWNKRVDEASSFMKAYNQFINRYSTDLQKVNLRFVNHDDFRTFFGNADYQLQNFYDNFQEFDFGGVKGRYLSCSYALDENHSEYSEALQQLAQIFEQTQKNGRVKMVYRTEVYYGSLTE